MNYAMFHRVAEILRRDDRIGLDIYAEDGRQKDVQSQFRSSGIITESFPTSLEAKWRRYDLYLSADITLFNRRATKKAHIFHGISFKGKAYTEHIKKYDKAFLIGPYQRRQFVDRGILAPDDARMLDIGMPKIDPLVNGEIDREEVLRKLGLDPQKPVVLYAPTWRKESSLNTMGEPLIDTVAAMEDVQLIVKIHDLSYNPATNRKDWAAVFREKQVAGTRAKFVHYGDITPLLAAADLLISDASSTANEFLLCDRPVIFMDVPLLIEKYRDSVDLETWGRKTGVVVEQPEQLPETIRAELAAPARLSEIRRAAAADYFYNPGHATLASVRAIYNLLELPQP